MKHHDTDSVFNHWRKIRSGEERMDADDQAIWNTVTEAVNKLGLFYQSDVSSHCATVLQRENDTVFSYEVYSCREEIDFQRARDRRLEAAAKLQPGQVLRNVRIGADRFSTVTINQVDGNGFSQITARKRGSGRVWMGSVAATSILCDPAKPLTINLENT